MLQREMETTPEVDRIEFAGGAEVVYRDLGRLRAERHHVVLTLLHTMKSLAGEPRFALRVWTHQPLEAHEVERRARREGLLTPSPVTRLTTSPPTDTFPQPKEAQPLSHALTSDQYNILTPRLCGLMVRRWP